MSDQQKDAMSTSLRGVPISLLSLLLLAVSVGLGEVGARLLDSEFLRWYLAYFGIAFSVWTYVFFFNRRYRFEERAHRLLLFLALSAVGFGLARFIFAVPDGASTRYVMILVLSLPAIAELILGRPILRRTPP